MGWKQKGLSVSIQAEQAKAFHLNAAVPSSGADSICMLKRSLLSEVAAPAVISIWAEGTESESRSIFGMFREEA